MTDNEIIEIMARAIYECHPAYQGAHPNHRIEWDQARHGISGTECYRQARSALTTLRSAGMAVVPREPDDGSIYAMRIAMREARTGGVSGQTSEAVFRAEYARELAAYRAMINAAEGAQE